MNERYLTHSFLAVEGSIGAGKTTLSEMIARDFGARLILEEFSDNPFLPYFYENPERHAFSVELFFMTERHKQLQAELGQTSLFSNTIVADYFFLKTLLFAGNNLREEEYRLFTRLFHILNANFPNPDLLVYLHRPVDQLLHNIRKRGRDFERDISPDYLRSVQRAYLDFFRTQQQMPVLVIHLEDADFTRDAQAYECILELISLSYEKGVHFRDLE